MHALRCAAEYGRAVRTVFAVDFWEPEMSASGSRTPTCQSFALGEVLSITTGCLLCDIGRVYEILNWMTDDNLFTHQLPRVSRECAPHLLKQHPQLEDVDASLVTPENWRSWLHQQEERFGARLDVTKLPADEHYQIDPMSELAEQVHPDKIIAVDVARDK